MDGSGKVVVTGSSNSGGLGYDYATVAYSSVGAALWTNRFDGPVDGDDWATGVVVDGSGNVFVTGSSLGSGRPNDCDCATIKYSVPALSPIPLNYGMVGNQLVLSWTNAAFHLQSGPAVQGNFTNISGAISPFTNSISGPQQYFRLQAN